MTAAVAVAAAMLAGCASGPAKVADTVHPNLIVVTEFPSSPRVVTLDRSLGFSLYRGAPGVSPTARAESVARAAAFSLADAITQELTRQGYDALHVEEGSAAPAGRALIVTGAFRSIFEGYRHENASVAAWTEVSFRSAGSGASRQLSSFGIDSRRLPRDGLVPAAGRHGEDVNYQATRVGAAIGHYVGELARINHWPGGR